MSDKLQEAAQNYLNNFWKEYPNDTGGYYMLAFKNGANWQAQQDAKPETIERADPTVVMLGSIENRLIELAGGPGVGRIQHSIELIGKHLHNADVRGDERNLALGRHIDEVIGAWAERLSKEIYHLTTRQEQIDIQHRRYLDEILGLMRPRLARGPDETRVAIRHGAEIIPLEEISDEMLDAIKEQMPVGEYVAEVSRRKALRDKTVDTVVISKAELEALRVERDQFRELAEDRRKLLKDVVMDIDKLFK